MSDAMRATPEDVGISSERLRRVRGWMGQLVETGKLAGVQTMILRRNELVWNEVCGIADVAAVSRRPATPSFASTP